ncbi:MAG: hypothetical protein ACR2HJ_07575, partial [Fimbriimonadales bacterium]
PFPSQGIRRQDVSFGIDSTFSGTKPFRVDVSTVMVGFVLAAGVLGMAQGDIYPLERGTTWVYRQTTEGREHRLVVKVWNVLPDGTRQLKIGDRYAYRRREGNRVLDIPYRGLGGELPDLESPGASILNLPLELNKRWSYESMFQGQVLMTDEETRAVEPWKIQNDAVVTAVDETIAVPSGAYQTVRLETRSKGVLAGDATTVQHFAPGIGLVKQILTMVRGASILELVSLTRGRDVSDKVILESVAKNTMILIDNFRALKDPMALSLFRSRFFQAGTVVYKYTGGAVESFDADDPAEWNRLALEDRGLRGDHFRELLTVAARLAAVDDGFQIDKSNVEFLNPATGRGATFRISQGGRSMKVRIRLDRKGVAEIVENW